MFIEMGVNGIGYNIYSNKCEYLIMGRVESLLE